MKKQLRKGRGFKTGVGVTGALLGATLTGAAITGATRARDDNTPRMRAIAFPFVTLPRTQGVRLNATYTAPPDPSTAPPEPDRPCLVQFRLLDSEGRVVANQTSTLAPGKTGQLGFTAPPEPSLPPSIIGVRAELATQRGRCNDAVVGSLEIVDAATGEVKAVVGPALKANQLLVAPPEPSSPEPN